jgi:hypothetical protein
MIEAEITWLKEWLVFLDSCGLDTKAEYDNLSQLCIEYIRAFIKGRSHQPSWTCYETWTGYVIISVCCHVHHHASAPKEIFMRLSLDSNPGWFRPSSGMFFLLWKNEPTLGKISILKITG